MSKSRMDRSRVAVETRPYQIWQLYTNDPTLTLEQIAERLGFRSLEPVARYRQILERAGVITWDASHRRGVTVLVPFDPSREIGT